MKNIRILNNGDIFHCLDQITACNTEHHQTDVEIDKGFLTARAHNASENNPAYFFWLSRKSGTELYVEQTAFFKDTSAFNTLAFYADYQAAQSPHLYCIKANDMISGHAIGDLYALDYSETIEMLRSNLLKAYSVQMEIGPEAIADIDYNMYYRMHRRSDDISVIAFQPCEKDQPAFEQAINAQHKVYDQMPDMDFDEYLLKTFPEKAPEILQHNNPKFNM